MHEREISKEGEREQKKNEARHENVVLGEMMKKVNWEMKSPSNLLASVMKRATAKYVFFID